MIKRVAPNKYVVMSTDGKKKLTKPMPRAAAIKRLASYSQPMNRGGS